MPPSFAARVAECMNENMIIIDACHPSDCGWGTWERVRGRVDGCMAAWRGGIAQPPHHSNAAVGWVGGSHFACLGQGGAHNCPAARLPTKQKKGWPRNNSHPTLDEEGQESSGWWVQSVHVHVSIARLSLTGRNPHKKSVQPRRAGLYLGMYVMALSRGQQSYAWEHLQLGVHTACSMQ